MIRCQRPSLSGHRRTEASRPAREDATAYGMFREELVKFDLNEDRILVRLMSIHFGLTGNSVFHVARPF